MCSPETGLHARFLCAFRIKRKEDPRRWQKNGGRKQPEIDYVVGQERFIRLIGQHPVAQRVAQNRVGLTKNTGVLFGQRILKKHVAGAIQRITEGNQHFYTGRAFAALQHADVLKADADELAEFFLREVAGTTTFAETMAEGLIIHLHHRSSPPFEMK